MWTLRTLVERTCREGLRPLSRGFDQAAILLDIDIISPWVSALQQLSRIEWLMQVPASIPAKQLSVTLEPFYVKVARKDGSEVYLEGSLERGIVPQESVWTHGGGPGEDGFLLLLHKMNLELLQRQVPCVHCRVGTSPQQVACMRRRICIMFSRLGPQQEMFDYCTRLQLLVRGSFYGLGLWVSLHPFRQGSWPDNAAGHAIDQLLSC